LKMNRLASIILLLLFLVSTIASATTVEATPALTDVFQVKEYKQWSSYSPGYTFSKGTSSTLQIMSTTSDSYFGDAYAFMHISKDYLNGKKLRVDWRWYLDYSNYYATLSWLYVVDHQHDRHKENTDEFRTQSDSEHPITDYTYIQALSRAATSPVGGGWIDWSIDTSNILDLSGFSSPTVTIMFKTYDPWEQDQTGMEIDYLQILDSSNNVLKEYHFTGSVFMDVSSGYYDYGMVRKPSSVLWGTTNYPVEMDPPTGERDLSGNVSEYIHDLFSGTGKYSYCEDYWGSDTQPTNVYDSAYYSERYYDYSLVFYKGHVWGPSNNCNDPNCQLLHYGEHDNEGIDDPIKDYYVSYNTYHGKDAGNKFSGTHDFVFIWNCGLGADGTVGVYNQDHSSGLLAGYMNLDPDTLSDDAYGSPDNSDHVFIGFEWLSKWYEDPTLNPTYNYGHFAYQFYNYLLQGYTVNDALDMAAFFVSYGITPYLHCELKIGYDAWNPNNEAFEPSAMRVWGDGNHIIPK
jgi:hypothetical protein